MSLSSDEYVEISSTDEESSDQSNESNQQDVHRINKYLKMENNYECVTIKSVMSWFKDLATNLEEIRTREILPECIQISESMLLELDFDIQQIFRIYSETDDIKKSTIKNCTGIQEPRKAFEPAVKDKLGTYLTCQICFENAENDDSDLMYSTGFCGHYLCGGEMSDCVTQYIKCKADERLVDCPSPQCAFVFTANLMDIFRGKNEKEEINQEIFKMICEKTKKPYLGWRLVPCEKPDCAYFFKIDKKIIQQQFEGSFTIVCECGAEYCLEYLLSQFVQHDFACPNIEGHEPISCELYNVFENFNPMVSKTKHIRDSANESFIRENTRDCPSCGTKIMKDQGCNHMRCSCGAFFCWKCTHKYTREHEDHECKFDGRGNFLEDIVVTVVEVSVHKAKHDMINETMRIHNVDFAYLSFKFKGRDPKLMDKIYQDYHRETEDDDSGLENSYEAPQFKLWDEIDRNIRKSFAFDFSFPRVFLSEPDYRAGLFVGDHHLFDLILEEFENNMTKLQSCTRRVECFLKFRFFLVQSTLSTIMANQLEDFERCISENRRLGHQVVEEIIKWQDPKLDFASFYGMIDDNGRVIRTLLSDWSRSINIFQIKLHTYMKTFRQEKHFLFWRETTKRKNPDPEQGQSNMIIDLGDNIMWDTERNEPVSYVSYN